MSEANQSNQQEEVKKPPVQWTGVSTDLSSFKSYGIVPLSDGQQVNVEMQVGHGLTGEKLYADFKQFVLFLDLCAQDHAVKFWDGKRQEAASAPSSGSNGHDAPQGSQGSNGNEFPAGTLTVEYKNKKAYFSISGVEGAKFPKFPVRVWPEVLEGAGIDVKQVDPIEGFPLTGWTAVYVKSDEGKVQKVVELKQPEFMDEPA